MRSIVSTLLLGLLVWVIPFVVALLLFPLRTSDRVFFESIMPVVLTFTVLGCSLRYFKRQPSVNTKEGLTVGIIWIGISFVLDLLVFSRGPMAMPIGDYLKDIGFTYLIILAIPFFISAIAESRQSTPPPNEHNMEEQNLA